MKDGTQATVFAHAGRPFQLALIATFIYRTLFDLFQQDVPILISIAGLSGAILFAWCLYVLYYRRDGQKKLLTHGVFRYTRHPMYTGVILMDLRNWFVPSYNAMFWISTAVLYVSLAVAGYLQERETLARFGAEAENYYKRTPRFFFLYPWIRWRKAH